MFRNKKNILVSIALVFGLLLTLVLASYIITNRDALRIPHSLKPSSDSVSQKRIPPAGFKEYRNEQFRFSVFLPEKMSVRVVDEGLGAATISFEDLASETGYQLFIVPHTETFITEERFRADVPSGVRENTVSYMIDGTEAAGFDSVDAMLGNTFEFWFVKNGYVYEVTTFREEKDWLLEQLATWQFTPAIP